MIPTTTDAAIERLRNFSDSDVPHSAKFFSNLAGDIRFALAEITRLREDLHRKKASCDAICGPINNVAD